MVGTRHGVSMFLLTGQRTLEPGAVCRAPTGLAVLRRGCFKSGAVDVKSSEKRAQAVAAWRTEQGIRRTFFDDHSAVHKDDAISGLANRLNELEELASVTDYLGRGGNGVGENIPLLHTARYNFNDDNLTVGSAYWVRLAERFLE